MAKISKTNGKMPCMSQSVPELSQVVNFICMPRKSLHVDRMCVIKLKGMNWININLIHRERVENFGIIKKPIGKAALESSHKLESHT